MAALCGLIKGVITLCCFFVLLMVMRVYHSLSYNLALIGGHLVTVLRQMALRSVFDFYYYFLLIYLFIYFVWRLSVIIFLCLIMEMELPTGG